MNKDVNDIIAKYGKQKASGEDVSWELVAKTIEQMTGVTLTANAVRKRYKRMCESETAEVASDDFGNVHIATNPDGSQTSERNFELTDELKLRDVNFLMRIHNYDPNRFELVSSKSSKWQSGSKVLYSSKIVVKPKTPEVDNEHLIQWFLKLGEDTKHEPVLRRKDNSKRGKLLVLPISDLHYGMLSAKYDTASAKDNFRKSMSEIISRINPDEISEIVYTIGGDFINCDNSAGTTSKGTPQDNDGLFYEVIGEAFNMTVRAIEDLLKIAPVQVVCLTGNHDKTASMYLGLFCMAWFKNDPQAVFRFDNANPRIYTKFGKTLLCFAHDANEKTLPRTIADERREWWASVSNTEVFLQHQHTEYETRNDYHMRINRLPAACECSNWAVSQGYVARPQCKAFLFDEEGLSDVMYVNL